MSRESIVEARAITKRFTHPEPFELLRGIDVTLARGETVAIIGKSGEGKTTLLHILATLDTPTSGTIKYPTAPLKSTSQLRNEEIGFVFQSFCLLQDLNLVENLLMPCSIARKSTAHTSACHKRALELLSRVGLYEKRTLIAAKLSGGQMQRLAIARAFMQNPSIIFADEPTGNLDHEAALQVQQLLFSWVREEGKALCIVTHNHELAGTCDRILRLEDGLLTEVKNGN